MRKLAKYRLEIMDLQSFEIPIASDILSVSWYDDAPAMWVREDDDANSRRRMVNIWMVGAERSLIPPGSNFIGTVTFPSGKIVVHFFEGASAENIHTIPGAA